MNDTQYAVPFFHRIGIIFQRSFMLWEKPYSAMFLAGMIFLLFTATAGAPWRISINPYHNYLADAFLHGQLNLRLLPPDLRDLSLYQGQYYLYWGPFPAILMMPFVALFGVGVSDVLQSLVAGTMCVGIFALLLQIAVRREILWLSLTQRAFLVLFFSLGTALTPLPAVGRVWELSSIWTVCFALLSYLAAFALDEHKAFFWTGVALAAVAMTRISAVFIGVFLAWYLLHRYWNTGWRKLFSLSLVGLAPMLIAAVLLMGYNYLRFGNGLDNGLNYQQSDPFFIPSVIKYGFFNVHYIPINIFYQFICYPIDFSSGAIEGWGGSLFLLSPLFFAIFYALWFDRRRSQTWVLFITVLIGTIPTLVNIAPGTFQFGPRYTLDYVVPLLLLTAMGMRRLPTPIVILLIMVSILHYLLGALMFAHVLA